MVKLSLIYHTHLRLHHICYLLHVLSICKIIAKKSAKNIRLNKSVLNQFGHILNELDGSFVGTGTAANFAGATSMTMMMALHTGENGENGS